MISASIAETHRFGRVRKNGYDPAEVDAVIARLVDALRRHDERINALTIKIDAADASADAIRKTFVAAQDTRDEIIEAAQSEAATIKAAAATEATELAHTVEELQAEIAASRGRLLTDVYAEAERRMTHLERATAQRSVDAAWAVRDAIDIRNRAVSDSEAETQAAAHKAELEAAQIRSKIATMSRAAVALEEAAETLANSARDGAKVIDLSAMEQLDVSRMQNQEPNDDPTPDGGPETRPTLAVAEAPAEVDNGDQGPTTRYQRSTGVPLKERIKIARMSG